MIRRGSLVAREADPRDTWRLPMPTKPPVDDELSQRARRLRSGRNAVKAGRALGELGARAVPALLEAVADANPFVRSGAVHGLGAVRPAGAEVVAAIAAVLEGDDDPRVRETACAVLGGLGAEAVAGAKTALDAATRDDDERVRLAAKAALAAE